MPPEELTREERLAIAALHRLAKHWPKALWLFSASGGLHVMKVGLDGERVYLPTEGVDPDYCVASVDLPNDGGDW